MVRHHLNQNYSKLKRDLQRRSTPEQRELFRDPHFPPTAESLFFSGKNDPDIVWKRPGEICDNPKLVVDGLSSTDLNQGTLGNCWFVAACSALATERRLWDKVVTNWREQEWDDEHPERYAGIFHFQFWRLGEHVDVVVDDYLPTKHGELVYMKSKDTNEFWSALLEKAYAKLSGSYEGMTGGQTGDALVDFTGGVNEVIDIREGGYAADEEKMKELFDRMEHAHNHRALSSCSISLSEGDSPETVLDCGLIKGHAYGISDIRKVALHSGLSSLFHKEKLLMVKLRNPWGQKEWNGAWSDGSPEWQRVPESERNKLGIKVDDDGDFWMEFHDWCKWFTDCSVCRQVNTSLLSLSKRWHEAIFHTEWAGRSAGGCINHKETFLNNPQFVFTIPADDTEVMVSLSQKDVRSDKEAGARKGGENLTIGFHIMKVEENRFCRVHVIQEKAGAITYTNRRSVFGKFDLSTGCYVIVPSTFDPGQEREFMLRLYSERPHDAKMLTKEIPTRGVFGYLCCCCWHTPHALVTVHLDSAHDLTKQGHMGAGADPYCIVKCEGTTVRTPVRKNTLEPLFNSRVCLYVSKPATSLITVQVWNSNTLVDTFMGQVEVPIPNDGDSRRHSDRLMDRGRRSEMETQGTVTFRVGCSFDLRAT